MSWASRRHNGVSPPDRPVQEKGGECAPLFSGHCPKSALLRALFGCLLRYLLLLGSLLLRRLFLRHAASIPPFAVDAQPGHDEPSSNAIAAWRPASIDSVCPDRVPGPWRVRKPRTSRGRRMITTCKAVGRHPGNHRQVESALLGALLLGDLLLRHLLLCRLLLRCLLLRHSSSLECGCSAEVPATRSRGGHNRWAEPSTLIPDVDYG